MTKRSVALHPNFHPSISNLILERFFFFACLVVALASTAARAQETQTSDSPSTVPGIYHPAADPKAVVIRGNARFSVLTPQLIRMEWVADGKFEDHASLVFLNRKLPVPTFTSVEDPSTHQLVIKTSALELRYKPNSKQDGKFSSDNLDVTFTLNGKPITWHPGMPDTGNLMGTTRTLDGALGDQTKEPIELGLLSRDGWTLVDDSSRPLFDSADFSFVNGEKVVHGRG